MIKRVHKSLFTSLALASLCVFASACELTANNADKLKSAAVAATDTTEATTPVVTTTAGTLTVALTSLTGGQALKGGASAAITWTASDTVGLGATPIQLEYSSNSGTSWTNIGAAQSNSGSYSWTVPSVNGSTYRVRVTATNSTAQVLSVSSTSDITIDSTQPAASLTAPVTSQYVKGSAALNVTWTASDSVALASSPILLEYSTNSGTSWTTIGGGAMANSSPYSWSVPALNSTTVRVRLTVTDAVGNTNSSSTGDFTVDTTAPSLTLTTPAAGVYLKGGATYSVAWTASDTT